ncbi:SIS domain-containing protein [Streptomyces radiopugnans]|uniref:Fructoselysine-6-P-deglycase FrlB with duplicated sugar isomerase (SIS) domain n=1 Tax=Streptomyces radiopugnans TaxID=403935 RepID=A0A1H9EJ92_9ACTN|nr:sugar isomerase [Streptomyces radiopugnans]SEQ25784.1 Fructoselysine-6-P-deglycase FrlB with duplicated sugar isomerase (SIS) domain [Streptomyces radiopugnans]
MSAAEQSRTAAEIATQPGCWRRAARAVESGSAGALPRPGERVAVTGCGTSWFMAQSYAALREAAGQGETDAFAASEFPAGRAYDRVVAITRSGTTSEVLGLLAHLRGRVPTTALTADPATPVMEAADHTAVLDWADEESVVQTRFATTALALLRAGLERHGALPAGVKPVEQAAVDAELAVVQPLPPAALGAEQWTFLGRGWTYGLALEAALKMREAAGAWTEAYPAMEYRHGPIAIARPGRAVWLLGSLPEGLSGDIARVGGALLADSDCPGTGERALDPMADLIRAQRLAVALAEASGADPDRPRNLTRSVVLG